MQIISTIQSTGRYNVSYSTVYTQRPWELHAESQHELWTTGSSIL